MSFSEDVKKELSKFNNLFNKQEVKYEFLGYLASDNITQKNNKIRYSTENDYNIDRFTKIIRNVGIEEFDININGKLFFIEISYNKVIGLIEQITESKEEESLNEIFKDETSLKPFIRGLFMGSGSINNPAKKYHLECRMKNEKDVTDVVRMMQKNEINLKQRQNIIYIKEGEEISKFLAFIGATKSVLKFEEIRVQRYMNNKVNRIVNCKSANLNKVLNASVEQVEAIRKLKQNGEYEKLDENLKEIAELRLENPDMSLIELGKQLNNPIGKSGVNYRLKKIIRIAEMYDN